LGAWAGVVIVIERAIESPILLLSRQLVPLRFVFRILLSAVKLPGMVR